MKVEKKVFNNVSQTFGILISLKKTDSCCSVLVEPKIDIVSLKTIMDLKIANKVKVYQEYDRIIAFDLEIFDIYPKQSSFSISMSRFPIRRPRINIPAEIVAKEVCN